MKNILACSFDVTYKAYGWNMVGNLPATKYPNVKPFCNDVI